MATVMSRPPSLPDRGNRPAPPALNKLPSRNRTGSTSNINRPLPSIPQDKKITKSHASSSTSYQNGNRVPVTSHPIHSSQTLPRSHRDLPRTLSEDPPPPVPPRRPETVRPSNKPKTVVRGYEERFHFHKFNDFPEPDDFSGKKKRYTSIRPSQGDAGQIRTSRAS